MQVPVLVQKASPAPGVAEPGLSTEEIIRMEAHAEEAARLLKHLAHETRLLILCHLWERELSVGELNERVRASQSALSQHLAILRSDGLVETRRQAQSIFYQLADQRAARVLALLHGLYCGAGE